MDPQERSNNYLNSFFSNIKRCFKKDRERDDDRFVIVVALYVGQICRQPMSVEDEPP